MAGTQDSDKLPDDFDEPYLAAGADRLINLRHQQAGEAVRDMLAEVLYKQTVEQPLICSLIPPSPPLPFWKRCIREVMWKWHDMRYAIAKLIYPEIKDLEENDW
jgi:hypothetical protein